MTKTEIENKIYDLKRTIESCENIIKANKNEIKKLEAEKEKPAFERVEEGKKYYVVDVDSYGGVLAKEYIEKHMSFDEYYFKNNNYFHTKERAEEAADKINFLLKLERLYDIYCHDYKPDWYNSLEDKYYILFDHKANKYIYCYTQLLDTSTIHFDSRKTAEKVCKELNKEMEKKQ